MAMDKNALYEVLSSEFWKEVVDRMAVEKQKAIDDLKGMDFTTDDAIKIAIKYQARFETFDELNKIIEDMKEEAMQEVNNGKGDAVGLIG